MENFVLFFNTGTKWWCNTLEGWTVPAAKCEKELHKIKCSHQKRGSVTKLLGDLFVTIIKSLLIIVMLNKKSITEV